MKKGFLPIGTVDLLKGGTKEKMITSYCIFPKNTEKKIEKICYMGYETNDQKKLLEILDKEYNKYKLEYIKESL